MQNYLTLVYMCVSRNILAYLHTSHKTDYICFVVGLLQSHGDRYRGERGDSDRCGRCPGLRRDPGHYSGAVPSLLLLASTTW